MGCSVLTVVVALLLIGHLSVCAGQTYGQEATDWPEAADDVTPSQIAVEAQKLSEGRDGRRSALQLDSSDGDSMTSLSWDASTTAPVDIMTTTSRHLISKGDDQDDITTSTEEILTTPPGDSFTTSQESFLSTTQGNVPTTCEDVGDLIMTPILEDGRVKMRKNQLVVCACPLLPPADCRRFLSNFDIDWKDQNYEIKKPVASLSVAVHNVTCEKMDHRLMNFSEGQFLLRDRGFLVLHNVGQLEGLIVNDYCADPRMDSYGNVTWAIKACIPPPSVPRCCPIGQALRDGKCETASTPDLLQPPMPAGMNEPPIYWPVIKNHYNPLTCPLDRLTSVPLIPDKSYLLAAPTGLTLIWISRDDYFIRPPDLCVDGYVDASGSVRYNASFCKSDPEELHHRVCDGHICVRKCCEDDEEVSLTENICVPSCGTTYTPNFTSPPDHYRIVNGMPLCQSKTLVNESTVDSKGHFHFNGEALTAMDYCVDKFKNGLGEVSDQALVCIKDLTGWTKIRQTVLPVCRIISLLFLTLTVGCFCLVPELLQGGGWYQLFHVLSLMLAYASILAQGFFMKYWATSTCLAMAIVLQFAYLAAFFWLSVLCFEIRRIIRSLNNCHTVSTIPIWVYLLYAFGVPAAIGVLTVCMTFFAPDGVAGVVKPKIAIYKCTFEDDESYILYFYGPITLLLLCNIICTTDTFWTFRKIDQNSSILKKNSAENTAVAKTMKHTHRKRDYVSDFKGQVLLLALVSYCWVSDVLSLLIPPRELWSVTDTLNSLQGFFIFVIFIANKTKRKHLKRKFQLLFKMAQCPRGTSQQCCCCQGSEVACLSPVSSFTSHISRKLSSSSVASSLSTLSTSLKFGVSSVSVNLSDDENVKKPSVFEPQRGVITLSHSALHGGDTVLGPLGE